MERSGTPASPFQAAFPASGCRWLGTVYGLPGPSTAGSASPCAPAGRQFWRNGYSIQPPALISPCPIAEVRVPVRCAGRGPPVCTLPGHIRRPFRFGLLAQTGACHHRPAKQNERPCGRSKLPNSGGEVVARLPCGERRAGRRQYSPAACAAQPQPSGHRSGDPAPTRLFDVRASSNRMANHMPQCALRERTLSSPRITCASRLAQAARSHCCCEIALRFGNGWLLKHASCAGAHWKLCGVRRTSRSPTHRALQAAAGRYVL